MSSVWAVVVTHNRRDKLRLCLEAIAAQQRPPDRILVVDNASTDGTREMLEREYAGIELVTMATNAGGAGGFHEGLKEAYGRGASWIWLMDDDTIPEADALAELLSASNRVGTADSAVPTLLASRALWRDGTVHPLNFPTLERGRVQQVIEGASRGVAPMRDATFVSLLVNRATVDRYQLPLKHFFLWCDDIEYTSRVALGGGQAWFVPSSVVVHDTETADDFRSAAPDRFYYHVRNTLLMALSRDRPWGDRALRLWVALSTSARWLRRRRDLPSFAAVARALRDALLTRVR